MCRAGSGEEPVEGMHGHPSVTIATGWEVVNAGGDAERRARGAGGRDLIAPRFRLG